MARWKAVAVLAGAALVALAGATARPAGASGPTTQTFNYSGGLQTFTVPAGVTTLTIQAVGAAGGSDQYGMSGSGASMQGDFSVTPGDTLTILVGEQPYPAIAGGGGGGSFVWRTADAASADNLLLAAGGGGGGGCTLAGNDASIGENGTASSGGNPGGTAGQGGAGGAAGGSDADHGEPGGGGGGGGLLTSGGDGAYGNDGPYPEGLTSGQGGPGGQAISLGGDRGYTYDDSYGGPSEGGFGGGGAAALGPAGGGGGYSGGGGGSYPGVSAQSFGTTTSCDSGGGGGSYNAGANQVNQAGVGYLNGYVVISYGVSAPTDTTPPTITASATSNGEPYDGGTWTNQPVQVHFDCTDDGSGVASVTPDQYYNTDQNDQSVTGTCIDNAGNQAQATFSGIDVDRTPPTGAISAVDSNGNPYAPGTWSDLPITVVVSCTDDLSGVAGSYGGTTVSNASSFSDTGECIDNAGNTSATPTISDIMVDTTKPTVIATATVNGSPYGVGTWTNQDVVVGFTCTDGLSGVGSAPPDQTVSTEGFDQSATGTCTDIAGNQQSATFDHIWIDKTPPTVTFSGNQGTYALNDTVSITCSATDALSHVATNTCANVSGPAWTFGTGETISATATDYAGNSTTSSTSFTVVATFAGLEGLVSQFCTNPGVAAGLNAKLDAASAAKARGQTKTEQSQLNAFDNQLAAQTGKCLTATQAAQLAQFASTL